MTAPTVPRPPTSRLAMVGRQVDYWTTVYRRTWRGSVFSSFVMPLFYVVAMGVLLGGFVDEGGADLQGAPSYLAFIAPGLVAAHAMQMATGEVTWPVMGMVKWNKTYLGMIASPLSVGDIVAAHFCFVLFRVATAGAIFLGMLSLFGIFDSLIGVLGAFLAQLLVGMAFATPLYAFSAGLTTEAGFAVVYRVLIVPLFLFSGAFFPIENLPAGLEQIAMATPLWHGVDLTRMLTLGRLDAGPALVHVAYLAALVVVGWWWAVRRLTRRLVD
jgi:lipooligosaccharide transport system permease protein